MSTQTAAEYLDQLDALRVKVLPGGWLRWTAPDVTAIAVAERTTASGVPSNPARWIVSGASGLNPDDAALIVAAVNALPQLVGALRAVLEIHHPVSQNVYAATPLKDPRDVCAYDNTTYYPCPTVQAINAALSPAEQAQA